MRETIPQAVCLRVGVFSLDTPVFGSCRKRDAAMNDNPDEVRDAEDVIENAERRIVLQDLIWPETGLATRSTIPDRPKDGLTEDDIIELTLDFVTLSLTPLEFIQLAAFLRMSIDDLLERHPSFQRAVVSAFDIRE